jgi:pimeloyl-ACP methyl ester carboxylesterase
MAISHVCVGSGEQHRVIAIHGWFGSAGGWGSLPGYLDPSAFTVALMDLRGYGRRKDVSGAFTMAEAAADAIALADELGWDRFSLIGHSMGGKAIQQVLLQAPGRVRRLIAVNPVPASAVPFDERGWALFSSAATDPASRAAIIDVTTGGRLTKTFVDHVVRHSLENSTPEAFAAYLPAWAKADFTESVKGNDAHIKVIVGDQDPAMSAAVMEQTYLEFFPHAELEVLPNAGHYLMYEAPAALAASIEEYLNRG